MCNRNSTASSSSNTTTTPHHGPRADLGEAGSEGTCDTRSEVAVAQFRHSEPEPMSGDEFAASPRSALMAIGLGDATIW